MTTIDTGRFIAKIIDFLMPKAITLPGDLFILLAFKKRGTGHCVPGGCGGAGTAAGTVYFS